MIRRFAVLLTLTIGAFSADRFATSPDPVKAGLGPSRLSQLHSRMQQFVDRGTAAGFVTLVARHGQVAALDAIGWQDREARMPMRTDTIFQIMSMTKPVTCAGIMILVDEGRLSINDPLEKFFPAFKDKKTKGGAASRPVIIRDLMTHTSGVPASPPKDFVKSAHTLAEAVDATAQLPLDFEPGVRWSYSNMGIAMLGRIIEIVSGTSFEDFERDRIFVPLNMLDTSFFLPEARQPRLAAVYTEEKGSLTRDDRDRFRKGWKYPMPEGGLYSTALDMARFYQMMLNKGSMDGRRILSRAAVELMTTVHTGDLKTGFAPGVGYGLGWAVARNAEGMFRYNSIGTYSHGGAYRTYGFVDPARDMLGVLLFQRTNGGGDMADEINSFVAMATAAIEE